VAQIIKRKSRVEAIVAMNLLLDMMLHITEQADHNTMQQDYNMKLIPRQEKTAHPQNK
jgi:hypothetical protein